MININDLIKEKRKEHNPNWPQIPDHPCRILITKGSGPGKPNPLFSLISQQPFIYLTIKQNINFNQYKQEITGLKHCKDSKAFVEYSNDMDDIYKNIEECNPNREHKILFAFDDRLLICSVIKNLI